MSSEQEEQIAERIAKLNDLCRTAMGVAGRLVQNAPDLLHSSEDGAIRSRPVRVLTLMLASEY